jgi:hypothetical protein
LGGTVSPYLAGTRPLRWAAVHFSECTRNNRRGDHRAAWEEVLWPFVGAYKVLTEAGMPVGVVNDQQLAAGHLAGYGLIVLPNSDELTVPQLQKVEAFQAGGGIVINNDPAWGWSNPSTTDTAAAALQAIIEPHTATAPVEVTGGPAGSYAVSYRNRRRLVVAVTNDFNWVQITRPNKLPKVVKSPAPPASDVTVTWRAAHGLPPRHPRPGDVHRLRGIEAVGGSTLAVDASGDKYRVTLPTFSFMALLVVSERP